MNIRTVTFHFALLCGLYCSSAAQAGTPVDNISHLGPTITATVQRGDDQLPIYLVDHLLKGDRIIVTTTQEEKTDVKWLILLATVTPISNTVETRPLDLSQNEKEASIDIKSDDQVPIIVLAPQVRTMFGLHTSFSESSTLISDAIRSDPQRFVDLQKIDQINHAITYLLSVLDSVIQSQKPEQAVDVAKGLAAKFGVRHVNPDCFKDSTVNTKCVAFDIVSSENLTIPSDDIWSTAGPNSAAVKMPTDVFAGLKLVTETSTYLVNKYGDNYDFAPALGQRTSSPGSLQLYTNARFKNGDIKTAYVYVPSWFSGKAPEINFNHDSNSCLTKNELVATIKGKLPLLNYWHDWNLVIYGHGSTKELAHYKKIDFQPDSGKFHLDDRIADHDFTANDALLDARLTGKFGFSDVVISPFTVVLPANDIANNQVTGINNLIAGEKARLAITGKPASACIESLSLAVNDKTIGSSDGADSPQVLSVDLTSFNPGPAKLKIQQYGAVAQELPVTIFKRRSHLQYLIHYDLDDELIVSGDNLDHIDNITLNENASCHPLESADFNLNSADLSNSGNAPDKRFKCPDEFSSNGNFPEKVTIKFRESDPPLADFPVKKMGARPHMRIDNSDAIITKLSPLALQWNLKAHDPLITDDSGLGMLLSSFGGYKLLRGTYMLQIKFADDPLTDEQPVSVPLMSDLAHNELRTKKPVSFSASALPSVINPIWYRVLHQPSGLAGDWQSLNRSVVYLPKLTSLSCKSDSTYLHGSQLELLDWVSNDSTLTKASPTPPDNAASKSMISQCGDDQCLELKGVATGTTLKVKLHWIDDRLFDVTFPASASCPIMK